ncbi:hypothetical protein JWJ88_15265 [Paracoccus methylovorus]|uniref:Uncharacterized protein n=2 Tax=Paracoccus TaxID=265 RepID=A0A7H9BYN0_PARPN|nr:MULTISPECIES: hypothetical protein [Paracoccus]MDK8873303.1 hypothetical protein [Paracoccus sp. SSJ]QLH14921.1 hypothetical protein HYQ43_11680 [Paracoccus pantotrophus]QRZ15675.1 hypothetical protein JWJ88_15265 [Paracoccus methylovorus]
MASGYITIRGGLYPLPLAALLAGLSALPVFATEKHALGFDVAISLSSKAEAALKSTHEGISLSATYYGEPHPGDEKHTNAMGMVDLGAEDINLPDGARTVHVTGKTVSADRLRLISGGPMVNVNLFSSRKSHDDNILACDFIDGAVSSLRSGPVYLRCGLITENPETEVKP